MKSSCRLHTGRHLRDGRFLTMPIYDDALHVPPTAIIDSKMSSPLQEYLLFIPPILIFLECARRYAEAQIYYGILYGIFIFS